MSQASVLKSQSITNLDSTPVITNTSGEGSGASMLTISDTVSPVSGDTTSSIYNFVRIPTTAHVKSVKFYSTGVASAGAADINVRFSDSQVDGTPTSLQGTIPQISSANNKLFGAAVSILAVNGLDVTYNNITNYPYGSENAPLWAVLGYTADPGGFLDIVMYVTTAVTTGGTIDLKVDYSVPGSA